MTGREILAWLLEGDLSVRWQALRDLGDAAAPEVAAERNAVATAGWGAGILARQDPSGMWANGLYSPKWTSTFYSLFTLRALGMHGAHPQASRGVEILLDYGRCADGGLNFHGRKPPQSPPRDNGPSEMCITGMGLAIAACFQAEPAQLEPLAACIVREQMPDGGWNCEKPRGATHSSFHTTISVLDGILGWERLTGPLKPTLVSARAAAHEFLFRHAMYQSHTTGNVASPSFTAFRFPPQWHYDALRGLDYLREAGAPPDPRAQPAIDLVLRRRRPDGRWPALAPYPGPQWVDWETAGQPGRWNTLRALRVLRWWGKEEP